MGILITCYFPTSLSFKFIPYFFLSLKKNVYSYLLLSITHPMFPWVPTSSFSTEFLFLCLPLLCLLYRSPALSCHCITLVHCYFCFLAFVIELFQRGLRFYHYFKTTNSHTSKKVGYGTKPAVVALVIGLLFHLKFVKTY